MTIQERIYLIMREKKVQQKRVALDAGYTPQAFNKLLRGKKRFLPDDIVAICRALGVTPNDLIDWE